MSSPLLTTKLYIPLPGRYLVERAGLVEKLDQCLQPGCRLTLISAPAGFGKTTLIAAWVASAAATAGRMVAWLSLDEGDNDPVIFWSYLIAALQVLQPGLGQQALEVLALPGAALEPKLASLMNDLAQMPRPCVLVLDDYHLIRSPIIHRSLAFFIEHLPPHVHLMIASRTDPPLPLSLLRGRGQLLEIRLNDLRFSHEDAQAYLNSGFGLNLGRQSVQALNHKTEGWIAGLQMAALALQDMALRGQPSLPVAASEAEFVATFSGSNRFILDYLIEEVLNRQPEAVQQFLIQTALVDRMCGPLCDALLRGSRAAEPPGSQSTLEYLESSNLFIFPLDQQRYWYRYHQLFADLLRKRLAQVGPAAVEDLHRRAIQWYEQNGLIAEAVQHAFQIQDFTKAAALVAQVTEAMWGRGEHATLLAWMDLLPDAEKQRYPHLLTFQVSMLISAGKLKEAEACIPVLEGYIAASLKAPLSEEGAPSQAATPEQAALIGNVSALRTYIASFYGDRPALFTHAHTALKHLTREQDAGQRCAVSLVLGHAHLVEGSLAPASQALAEAAAAGAAARKPHMVLTSLSNLAEVLWFQGSLNRAAQVCQEGRQLIGQHHLDRSPMAADLSLAWGEVLCQRAALAEAGPFILQGLELAQALHYIWQTAWGWLAQARLLLAQGLLAEAESAAQAAEAWAAAHEVPAHVACEASGLLAQVWLRQGKTAQAARYLQSRHITADGEIHFPHQSEYLALARLLWLQGDAAADGLLERITRWAEARQFTGALRSALLLRALLAQSSGGPSAGLPFLAQALALAEPEDCRQLFLAEGEAAAVLLREAVRRDLHPEFAARLLESFSAEPGGAGERPVLEPQLPAPAADLLPLVEPLSRREMETLQLMAQGCSNKEIAQKLFISLRTVKYYSTGLYNKLGVDSRMQAVIRARALGLL